MEGRKTTHTLVFTNIFPNVSTGRFENECRKNLNFIIRF